METLRVFTAFSGYAGQCMARDRLAENFPGFTYELVGWSEIDKYAIQAHNAVYPQWADRNFGDISKIDWAEVPDFDLFTMSSPCQDFSSAGMQRGGAEGSGTRSSLLWECRKAILAKKPRYVVFENVKALVSAKFLPYFKKWQSELQSYGYQNFAQVLNAKDYGVPQNRERIFMISILDREASYHFPEPFKLEKRLKDVLAQNVDEKYYLSDRTVQSFAEPLRIPQATKQGYIEVPQGAVFDMSYPESTTRRGRVQDGGQVSPTLMAGGEAPCYFEGVSVHPNSHALEFKGQESIKQDAAPSLRATDYKAPHCVWEKGADELKQMATEARKEPIEVTINEHGSLRPHKLDKAKTGISEFQVENEEDTSSTLISARPNKTYGYTTSYRIRKLTPRECFRLMGVTETDIDKIQQSGVSQSQQYKMAGNSIVVDCLYHMFRKMFTETASESQQLSLF